MLQFGDYVQGLNASITYDQICKDLSKVGSALRFILMAESNISLDRLLFGVMSLMEFKLSGAAIRVRIGRMWESMNLKSNDIFSFNMQMLDEQGGEIQTVVEPCFMPIFLGKLREGLVYDISEFKVVPAGDRYLPVHKSIKIDFNALTYVSEVDDNCDKIPTHKFFFADHKTIVGRTDTIKYLTGSCTKLVHW